LIELNCGIRVGDHIHIDPTRKKEAAFVSHAHSDHLRNHQRIYGTASTLALAKHRIGDFNGTPLEYGKSYHFGDDRIRLESAGHILGSAQFIIEHDGQRIVYTGDFKLGHNDICPPAQIHACDILFMDTTFGRKMFNFPDVAYSKKRILEFVEACLHSNQIPVIFAYSLGKSQEVMKILGDNGFYSYAPADSCRFADIYNKYGVSIVNYRPLDDSYPEHGAVVVPPSTKFVLDMFPGFRKKTCLVSGWALNKSHINFGWVNEAIALSDHASYNELIEYVEKANPKKIYCLFGFNDIVEDLKYRGFNASKATLANQKNREKIVSLNIFE
jgi:putative mRNA 3-end processing factor